MNYEKKKILIELAIALFVAVSLFAVGFSIGVKTKHYEPTIVCDTIRTTDTVRLPAPPPDTVTKTVTKVKKVPLYITTTDTVVDSVLVRLPFEQHYAMLEDVADVWYSGYEAKIDSAVVYKHQQTIIETRYIEQQGKYNIIGVEAGTKDISLMYLRRFGSSFYAGFSAGCTYDGNATARGGIGIGV